MDINQPQPLLQPPDLLSETQPDYQLFSLNQMVVGSFFGGPFAGAYMMASNFGKLGLNHLKWRPWVYLILIYVAISLPEIFNETLTMPTLFFTILLTLSVFVLAQVMQRKLLQQHYAQNGAWCSTSKVVIVVVLCVIGTLLLMAFGFTLSDWQGFQQIFEDR
ncbi:MAG: hypothetical protein MUF24_06400 [Chitinophagaceae bacterium]|nr:hypothetical protein [Chitinophagaceae bacterium]